MAEIIGIILLVKFLHTAFFKGWSGEWLIGYCLRKLLNPKVYLSIHNVLIPDGAGGTTQIDHVVLSQYGFFVIETKNMAGRIYADEASARWMQIHYHAKHQFMSPIRQNYKHIKCLADALGLDEKTFVNMVVFIGSAHIQTRDKVPPSVVGGGRGMTNFIETFKDVLYTREDVEAVRDAILAVRLPDTWQNRRAHVKYVKSLINKRSAKKSAAPSLKDVQPVSKVAVTLARGAAKSHNSVGEKAPMCPTCGVPMVLREVKSGDHAGNKFWGCPNFPKCRRRCGVR